MNRLEKGVRAAIRAAEQSEFYSHKVGAAVFVGSKLISIGCNKHKSHPKSLCWSQHAEFNSLIRKVDMNLSKAILYVVRLTRTNRISYARPCNECQKLINSLQIKRVFYTNYQGNLEKLA